MAGTLEGLDRRDDAELAVDVMEFLQEGNVIGFFRVFSDPRAQSVCARLKPAGLTGLSPW